MSFINGFFLVNFLPLGLLTLAGVLLFFIRNDKQEKWYYPLLFIIIALTVISLWRAPVVISRRYAMPTIVPGIVISTFVLMLLPEILKKFKIPYANAVTRIIIIGLLTACVAKTMREQENKEYLHDIAEAVKLDCIKSNITKNVALLVFGNPGGHLELDKNVEIIKVKSRYSNARFFDKEYLFKPLQGSLAPDVLKIQYPHLYLLAVEQYPGSFSKLWEQENHDTPELILEHIRAKDKIAYRLYRVASEYKSAWINSDRFELMLANKDSLFGNGDLKKYRLSSESNIAKILQDRGISLFKNEEVYIPEGWTINPGDGWTANCSPVSIKFIEGDTNTLNFQSKDKISIYSNNETLDSNKIYTVAIQANSETRGYLKLRAYTYTGNGKYIQTIDLREIELDQKKNRYLVYFKLENCDKIRLALILSGDVSINRLIVVPAETTLK